MIERVLYRALSTGIEEITRDLAVTSGRNSILSEMFVDQYGLSDEEFDSIKTLWETKPPTVQHGYAHAESKFPLYCITLQGERESDKFIGASAGDIDDPEHPDFGAELTSSIYSHDYAVWVYSEHPDVTLYYYEVAKFILLAASDLFIQNFIMDWDVSGMDMMPDPRYIPSHLFVRQLKFSAKRELARIDKKSKLGKAMKMTVAGIHVDSSGSPGDVGGVKTNVKIIKAGGDDE